MLGRHSCIRLSGCPSLTIKAARDPLKVDPVAHVIQRLRGLAGLCGEVAQRGDSVAPRSSAPKSSENPNVLDRLAGAAAQTPFIGWLQPWRGGKVMALAERPIRPDAALGGEGGGVPRRLVIAAATAPDYPVAELDSRRGRSDRRHHPITSRSIRRRSRSSAGGDR